MMCYDPDDMVELLPDSHEGLNVFMDCARKSDFAKGVHTDDELRPRIAQGGQNLRRACTRTPDFAHGLHQDG